VQKLSIIFAHEKRADTLSSLVFALNYTLPIVSRLLFIFRLLPYAPCPLVQDYIEQIMKPARVGWGFEPVLAARRARHSPKLARDNKRKQDENKIEQIKPKKVGTIKRK